MEDKRTEKAKKIQEQQDDGGTKTTQEEPEEAQNQDDSAQSRDLFMFIRVHSWPIGLARL
jgi:hypothetical protein